MDAMQISRTGLDVEWQRLQVIAHNLANMQSSRTADGHPVRVLSLVSGPIGGFRQALRQAGHAEPTGVAVLGVEPQAAGFRRVYEPANPQADAHGFVSYPAVDHAGEMTLMIRTARAYEANLTALNIAHQMYAHALELGRQS